MSCHRMAVALMGRPQLCCVLALVIILIATAERQGCEGRLEATTAAAHLHAQALRGKQLVMHVSTVLHLCRLQMVAQAYPFVASKVLRRDTAGGGALWREMV